MTDRVGIDLTANDATYQFTPGTTYTVRTPTGPDKVYKYVQYSDAAVAGIAGDCVYYVKPAASVTGTVVTMDFSDSDAVGAGVLQAIITHEYYGWIQIRGVATLTTALKAGADGNALTAVGVTTDGTLDVSALVTDSICAYAIDADVKIVLCAFPY